MVADDSASAVVVAVVVVVAEFAADFGVVTEKGEYHIFLFWIGRPFPFQVHSGGNSLQYFDTKILPYLHLI